MKRHEKKLALVRRPLTLAVVAALGAFACAAQAEPLFQAPMYRGADMTRWSTNYLELGGAYQSQSSYKFGEWTGMTDKGGYLLGNFHFLTRGEGNRNYFEALGTNLGFDSRAIGASYTSQGAFSVYGSYQGFPFNAYDTTKFIYNGLGSDFQTSRVPGGITTAGVNVSPNPQRIQAGLTGFDIDTQRDVWRVGGKLNFLGNAQLELNYRQDNRSGNQLTYGAFFQGGGNPRSTALALPVADSTYQVEAAMRWAEATWQAQVSYWWSRYSPDNSSLTWQNPFLPVNGWNGIGFPNSYGQYSLYPGNTFNQVSGTGAWNFLPGWRLTGTAQYGWLRQDEGYLPYYSSLGARPPTTGLNPPVPLGYPALPQGSLNGQVDRTYVNLQLTGRVLPTVGVRARYVFDNNDNTTGNNLYRPVPGSVAIGAPVDSTPYGSYRRNRFTFEGDWNVMRQVLVRGWWTTAYTQLTNEERDNYRDNVLGAEGRYLANEWVTGGLKYEYWRRTGSEFETVPPAVGTTGFVPVRPYFYNNFTQDRVRAFVDLSPLQTVGLQVLFDWTSRNYNDPLGSLNCSGALGSATSTSGCFGLQKASWNTITVDGQWRPIEPINLFAFYSYGDLSNEQLARQYSGPGFAVRPPSGTPFMTSPNGQWSASLANKSNTVGVGGNWAVANAIDVGATYIFNFGQSSTGLGYNTLPTNAGTPPGSLGGVGPNQSGIPNVDYRLNSFQLYAKYQYNKNWAFRANYWFQHLSGQDWAYDNVQPWSSDRTVFSGAQTPSYTVNVFGLSVAYTGF